MFRLPITGEPEPNTSVGLGEWVVSAKFVKKLKKELKKSPGKAAVLAALLGVAAWFWAPLMTGMLGGSAPPPSIIATTANAPTPNATITPTPVATQQQYTWKQIAEAIDQDPRMLPAEPQVLPRDPFRAIAPEKPKEEVVIQAIAPPVVLDVAPRDAGLVLTSTIVGGRERAARLNGKTYHEGDVIKAWVADKPLEYTLKFIYGRSIVLRLGEKEYELKMLRPQNGGAAASTVGVSSDSPDFDPSVLEE